MTLLSAGTGSAGTGSAGTGSAGTGSAGIAAGIGAPGTRSASTGSPGSRSTGPVPAGPPPRAPRPLPGPDLLSRLVAALAVVLLGLDRPLALGITTGAVVVAALFPVWVGALHHYPGARLVVGLTPLTIAAGLWLAWLASDDHDLSRRKTLEVVLLLVAALGGVGLLLWARRVLSLTSVAVLYGVGALADALVRAPGSSNAFKYQLALPVTILVLALAGRVRSAPTTVLALMLLALVGITNEYRSYFGFCLLVAALGLFEQVPRSRTRRTSRVSLLVLMAGLVVGGYSVGSTLLVNGYLGDVLQQRSEKQVRESGSLLVGGRPEWAGTVALMRERPQGYGIGVVPGHDELWTAKQGLVQVGVPTDNGYVDNYMFGGQIKLHSVVADLWSNAGLVGLVLAAVLLGVLLHVLTTSLAVRRASPLVVFLVLNALWDLGFGPVFSTLPTIGLALGLGMLERRAPRGARPALPVRPGPVALAARP